MKNEILSLKNIYKFLTTNDYPVYSDGIIRKERKRGLTLNSFCDENILVDFKDRKNGKVIWRMDGSRNRYVSEICNRGACCSRSRNGASPDSTDDGLSLGERVQPRRFLEKSRSLCGAVSKRRCSFYRRSCRIFPKSNLAVQGITDTWH